MRPHPVISRLGWLAACGLTFGLGWRAGQMRREVPAAKQVEAARVPASLRPTPGEGTAGTATAAAKLPDLAGFSPAQAAKVLESVDGLKAREAIIRAQLARMPVAEWSAWIDQLMQEFMQGQSSADKLDLEAHASGMTTYSAVLNAIASLDPVGFMREVRYPREINNDRERQDRELVLMAWARRQPLEALRFLEEQLSSKSPLAGLDDDDTAARLAGIYARQDSRRAVEWASSLPEKYRNEALKAALAAHARTDPAQSQQLAESLPEKPRREAHKEIMKVLAETDPAKAAENWAALATDAETKKELAGEITGRWAQRDPAAALAWAAAQSGEAQREAVASLAARWAKTDYDAAWQALTAAGVAGQALPSLIYLAPENRLAELARHTTAIADPAARGEASAAMMRVWTHRDPEAASAWMAAQPAGEIRDQAIGAFVRWADVRDPEAGLMWAATMTDAARRQEAMRHIIKQLGGRAPAEAGPWLEQNTTLPAEERAELQRLMQNK